MKEEIVCRYCELKNYKRFFKSSNIYQLLSKNWCYTLLVGVYRKSFMSLLFYQSSFRSIAIKHAMMKMKILVFCIPIFIVVPFQGYSLTPRNIIESFNDTIDSNIDKWIKKEQLKMVNLHVPSRAMDCSK